MVLEGGRPEFAAAVGCRGTRLDRRRIRSPALGRRRCTTHICRGIAHRRRQHLDVAAGLRRVLRRARGRRCVSHHAHDTSRTGWPGLLADSKSFVAGADLMDAPASIAGATLIDYASLRVIWWLLLGVLLIGFAIMDGFDLGVGATFRFIGRTDAERRALLKSIEPVWEGNQVWFILGGGAAFAAWPLLYAASFSGLYLAMFLLLIALILRPVGFAFRNQLTDARWRNVWDAGLTLGGAVPSLLFGVAFGNLFLGLPFHYDDMQRSTYTGGFLDLLRTFALLAGVVSLSMLVLHGASYAALKVGGPMDARARLIGRVASLVFMLSFVGAGIWTASALGGYRIVGLID